MIEGATSPYPSPVSLPQPPDESGHTAFSAAYNKNAPPASKVPTSPGEAVTHAALNVASLVPGEGIAADLANAALWLGEGHKLHALAVAGMAFVPGGHELTSALGLIKAGAHIASGGVGIGRAELNKSDSKAA